MCSGVAVATFAEERKGVWLHLLPRLGQLRKGRPHGRSPVVLILLLAYFQVEVLKHSDQTM